MSIINRFPSGGGGLPAAVSRSDVNFYDYDGTLLFAYTVAQANALSALPTAPTHTGLTFQEWNYTLAQVNATTRAIDVGATYITDDGKTRLYIHIESTARANVPLYWSQTVSNGVTVDWGDGSSPSTYSGTGNISTSHLYSTSGDYVINLNPATGCTLGLGNGSVSTSVIGGSTYGYINQLRQLFIGKNVTSLGQSLSYAYALAVISIPTNVTSISAGAFSYDESLVSLIIPRSITAIPGNMADRCYSLTTVVLPSGVTALGSSAFIEDYSLRNCVLPDSLSTIGSGALSATRISEIYIPSGVTAITTFVYGCLSLISISINGNITSIDTSAFAYCRSIPAISLPSSVTSIGNSAFQYCAFLKEVHIAATTPPTLGGSSVFDNIGGYIYVPSASVDTYKAAPYWSEYVSKIVGE